MRRERSPSNVGRRGACGLPTVLLLAGCSGSSPSALDPHGKGAERVAGLWWLMFGFSMVAIAVVVVLVLWAVARRRGSGVTVRQTDGKRFVVIAGVVIPAVVLMITYGFGVRDMRAIGDPGRPADVTIDVIGHIWWWEVRYPDASVVTANEIHVPVGQLTHLRLTTADVNHSFWVPQLMPKTDLIAGRVNDMWLTAEKAGTYRGQCAEYCGLQHAHMAFLVKADRPDEFQTWLAREAQPAAAPSSAMAAKGRQVLEGASCATCHTVRGTSANGSVGPDLTHLASRDRLGAGAVPNTPGYLGGWISNSQSIKPGNKMPPQPLSPDQLQALIAYLETLH